VGSLEVAVVVVSALKLVATSTEVDIGATVVLVVLVVRLTVLLLDVMWSLALLEI